MTIILLNVVVAADGRILDLSSLPHTLVYTGPNLTIDSVLTNDGHIYSQTFTYNGSNKLTNVSPWVFVS